jgi:hypothetical protein
MAAAVTVVPKTFTKKFKLYPWSNPKNLPVGDLDIGGDQMPYIVAKNEDGEHVWMLLPIDQSKMAFNILFDNKDPKINARQKVHNKTGTLLAVTHPISKKP